MNRWVLSMLVLYFPCLVGLSIAGAEIVTLETQGQAYIADARVRADLPDGNWGNDADITVSPKGSEQFNYTSRVYLAFDIRRFLMDAGYDPGAVDLLDLRIVLTQYNLSSSWMSSVAVHFPEAEWDESTITWNTQPTFSGIQFAYKPNNGAGAVDGIEHGSIKERFRSLLRDTREAWKQGIVLAGPNAPYESEDRTWIHYASSEYPEEAFRPKFIVTVATENEAPSPTPLPPSPHVIPLDGSSLEANQLSADPPAGYAMGNVSFGSIPGGPGTDGTGMTIQLEPGQGVWIVSNAVIGAPGLARISGSMRASNTVPAVALVALNSPVDGQLAYTNMAGDEIPVADYRTVNLFYQPPNGQLQLAVQAVNESQSGQSTQIWVDNLDVHTGLPAATGIPVELETDGSFDHSLENLILGLNGADGAVIPFFETLTDIAIRLILQPQNQAANIATRVMDLEGAFPLRLLGQISVQRGSLPGGGTLAFVMSNGYQNAGLFRDVNQLPGPGEEEPEDIFLGSDFHVNNPAVPIHVVAQIGGPGADSSVVVDDLLLTWADTRADGAPWTGTEPTPTPPLPTPTPTPPVTFPDEFEPDNSAGDPHIFSLYGQSYSPPKTYTRAIDPAGDEDYMAFGLISPSAARRRLQPEYANTKWIYTIQVQPAVPEARIRFDLLQSYSVTSQELGSLGGTFYGVGYPYVVFKVSGEPGAYQITLAAETVNEFPTPAPSPTPLP